MVSACSDPGELVARKLSREPDRPARLYQLRLVQRATSSPVRPVPLGGGDVFDAWSCLVLQCAPLGRIHWVQTEDGLELNLLSWLPARTVIETLGRAVAGCNRGLRDTPLQLVLQACARGPAMMAAH